jgi:hypothetical protein
MSVEGLTGSAAAFADLLGRVYPDWTDRQDVAWKVVGNGELEVRVPSPCHRKDGDLLIFTAGTEVTVSFSHWHAHHFIAPNSEDYAASAIRLCRWLDAFLDDREVIINLYANAWVGSMSLWVGHGCAISPKARDEIGRFIYEHQKTTRYEVRSWSGGLDEEYPVTPGG